MPVPLPDSLPGDFCVLVYDKLQERFTLVLDDDDRSSYHLGSNVQVLMRTMRRWFEERQADEAIDSAREFGAAQVIFESDRVVPVYEKPKKPDLFQQEKSNAPNSLPNLRPAM